MTETIGHSRLAVRAPARRPSPGGAHAQFLACVVDPRATGTFLIFIAYVGRNVQHGDLQRDRAARGGGHHQAVVAIPPDHIEPILRIEDRIEASLDADLPHATVRLRRFDPYHAKATARAKPGQRAVRGGHATADGEGLCDDVSRAVGIGDVDRVNVPAWKERQRRTGGENPRGFLLSLLTLWLRQRRRSARKRRRHRQRDDAEMVGCAPAQESMPARVVDFVHLSAQPA